MKSRMRKHTLKFISVFLAIFLWVYVLNSEKVKFEKTVQLEFILPTDLVFVSRPPQEVVFMIEGPRAFVKSVIEQDDKLVIDLIKANPRRLMNFTVDIIPTQLSLPFGMIVERVLPRRLAIRLEKKASKIVPVKPKFTGQLPPEFSLEKYHVSPAEVEVFGPASSIVKLKEVSTKSIELDKLVGFSEIPLQLRFPDERMELETATEIKLSYEFKARSNLTLTNLPIRFMAQDKKFSSSGQTASLKLLVPETLKNRSNISSSVQIWADIPANARGKVEVPLKAIVPSGIQLLDISPKTIIVNMQ